MLSTKVFRKRFHMLAIPAKLDVVNKVKSFVELKTMPSGREMSNTELANLKDLLIWCDDNIFFDTTPSKYDDPVTKNPKL